MIKIGVVVNNKIIKVHNLLTKKYNANSLRQLKLTPLKIFIGYVNKIGSQVATDVKRLFKVTPKIYSVKDFAVHFNLQNINKNEIGIDILAFCFYVQQTYSNGIGICAGTATFIFSLNDKRINGVLLLPNILTTFNTTFSNTDLIKKQIINSDNFKLSLGSNTSEAINNGFSFNFYSLIKTTSDLFSKKYKTNNICVSGGYIPYKTAIKTKISSKINKNVKFIDNAVLAGYLLLNIRNNL